MYPEGFEAMHVNERMKHFTMSNNKFILRHPLHPKAN